MFYLRLNKIKILNNRELIGKAEVQLISFVTKGESDFPNLKNFFTTNDENIKQEILKEAVKTVLSSRVLTPITHVKDKHQIYFGNSGLIVHKTKEIPNDFSWTLLAIEKDEKTRTNAELLDTIITDKKITTIVNAVSLVASMSNPVIGAITQITSIVANSLIKIYKNKRDQEIGYFITSFIRQKDYPNLVKDKQDAPDTTGNMFVDYSIFGYENVAEKTK